MKKDIEWLKKEIEEVLYSAHLRGEHSAMQSNVMYDDIVNKINQLDEPETQKIIELKHELSKLESNNMELHISYDEQVKSLDNRILDLEHELYIEKTRGTKHKFFWFTAKKTPLITDVSYLSNENTLYGFKQPPNYHFIEHHDLRFITHCSLDDLIEQF